MGAVLENPARDAFETGGFELEGEAAALVLGDGLARVPAPVADVGGLAGVEADGDLRLGLAHGDLEALAEEGPEVEVLSGHEGLVEDRHLLHPPHVEVAEALRASRRRR